MIKQINTNNYGTTSVTNNNCQVQSINNGQTNSETVTEAVVKTKAQDRNFDDARTGRGADEWSDAKYNICIGCEHGCLYCYAKALICRTREDLRAPGAWQQQQLNPKREKMGAEVGRKGVVMFPTSHDITPTFLPEAKITIRNLLQKNKVLIVSKPHLMVIEALCSEFVDSKDKLMFRFSIGSADETLCNYWEPNAPAPQERIQALRFAHAAGFKTSVSMEPMLDNREGICRLVAALQAYVTDSIWLGKMNNIPQKLNANVPGFAAAVQRIKSQQTDEEILKLYEAMKDNPKVRFKDSIKEVLAKHKPEATTT